LRDFGAGGNLVEKIETVIADQIGIPKEAKDFITKLRQKYGLPTGEKQS